MAKFIIRYKNKKRIVGPGQPTFIVAEISANHHQKFNEAVKLIKSAKKAGVDAVKFQTYTPDTMTIDSNKRWFLADGKKIPKAWQRKTLYQLYQTAYTPWEWFPKLKEVTADLGLIFFSTAYDPTSVEFLEKLKVSCYKIASYEITDIPLLKKVAKTKKPVILSIGYASLAEVKEAIKTLRDNGTKEIAVLHCITSYSNKPMIENMNLKTILDIQKRFNVISGFSDNNAGIEAPIIAAILGASIIEKHFILKRSSGGPDAEFSIEPKEMRQMVENIRRAEKAMGKAHYGPANKAEEYNKRFRRSLFAVKDIKRQEQFNKGNIRSIRPAFGLNPKYLRRIIGKKASRDIKIGTPLTWDFIIGKN